MKKKAEKFTVNLFCSLMLLSFIPFLYTLVKTNLIADIPSTDGLGIAGHMEWFDLINETVQAFLIIPLFSLLNKCAQDTKKFKKWIFQSFLVVNVVYAFFAVIVFIYCRSIVAKMVLGRAAEVTGYLRLETIGFMIANIVSFVNVLFVVLEKTLYIYAMVILKTVFTVIGDLLLIPEFGVNGIAYSNIAVNSVCVALCLFVVFKEKLFVFSFHFDKLFIKSYLLTGLFSGAQILLDNIIYFAIVCKMVNAVAEQGNYWTANNIIWGFMLVPISALAEIIKKDCGEELTVWKMKQYHRVILVTFLAWLCFVLVLDPFLKNVMGIENFEAIRRILIILIPFYLVYSYTVLFDNILIGHGKTQYCFVTSVIVNLIYYPILYGLMLKGIFTPDITFICMMFGFGMTVHLGCSVVSFLVYKNIRKKQYDGGEL